ncbi:MAG: hypothetical protein IKJ99_05955 [Oscillospiraceae bacterium]|nr:hypothetical protein [Oscillospiraceae bacterium]
MKATKIFAAVFALLGICTAFFAAYLGFANKDAVPKLLEKNDQAQAQVVSVMDALCQGDFEGAGQLMLGQPQLGLDREPAEAMGKLLWDAYVDSLSYELAGDYYTTEKGLAQKVQVTCLDWNSVTVGLHDATVKLLEQRVENAEDYDLIYDENDQYREEFLMAAVYDAAAALLKNAEMKTLELTLNLSYQDGQWWVVADNGLLDVISGGTLN